MNHNSFPTGEQAPAQQDSGDAVEFPSFEEHMQQMEQQKGGEKEGLIERAKKAINRILNAKRYAAYNTAALTRPSLKNLGDLGDYGVLRTDNLENIAQKIHNGDGLESDDITSLAGEYGIYCDDAAKDFLAGVGLSDGKNFDVRTPVGIYNQDGEMSSTPLSISFENNHGTFTRVDIYRETDADGNVETRILSYDGKREEGVDVGYQDEAGRVTASIPKLDTSNEQFFRSEPWHRVGQ